MNQFDIEFETKLRLEQTCFERKKLELEMQMKRFEQEYQIMEEQRQVHRKVKRTVFEKMMFVPNQSVQETNQPTIEHK